MIGRGVNLMGRSLRRKCAPERKKTSRGCFSSQPRPRFFPPSPYNRSHSQPIRSLTIISPGSSSFSVDAVPHQPAARIVNPLSRSHSNTSPLVIARLCRFESLHRSSSMLIRTRNDSAIYSSVRPTTNMSMRQSLIRSIFFRKIVRRSFSANSAQTASHLPESISRRY